MIYNFVELTSTALTVITIIMAFSVVIHWRKDAFKAIRSREELRPEQWFIIGVFVGFCGAVADNIYWLLAWSFHYIDSSSAQTKWLFEYGVYFNIPFRQLSGIVAAYCHVRAAVGDETGPSKIVRWAAIIGLVSSATLALTAGIYNE